MWKCAGVVKWFHATYHLFIFFCLFCPMTDITVQFSGTGSTYETRLRYRRSSKIHIVSAVTTKEVLDVPRAKYQWTVKRFELFFQWYRCFSHNNKLIGSFGLNIKCAILLHQQLVCCYSFMRNLYYWVCFGFFFFLLFFILTLNVGKQLVVEVWKLWTFK